MELYPEAFWYKQIRIRSAWNAGGQMKNLSAAFQDFLDGFMEIV